MVELYFKDKLFFNKKRIKSYALATKVCCFLLYCVSLLPFLKCLEFNSFYSFGISASTVLLIVSNIIIHYLDVLFNRSMYNVKLLFTRRLKSLLRNSTVVLEDFIPNSYRTTPFFFSFYKTFDGTKTNINFL